MAINQAIWKISDNGSCLVEDVNFKKEDDLECLIQDDPTILSDGWVLIGRQVRTDHGKEIDFLAIDRNGNSIIIELKRDKTPREVVAQGLDYASWVKTLNSTRVIKIFSDYLVKYKLPQKRLDELYQEKFKNALDEDQLNQGHQIVIVCSEIDAATERIVNYLSDSNIPINVIFFKLFEDEGRKYLSRVWLIEPQETEDNSINLNEKVPWNGEYYVSFGEEGGSRNWDDARTLGFISAGGGKWYSNTLNKLDIGDRVWVNIPGTGYVGVGIVKDKAETADKVLLEDNGLQKYLKDIQTKQSYYNPGIDPDLQEYIVPVEWIKTVTRGEAVKELGFFGNQNSVCEPRSVKWEFTINRLKELWNIDPA